MAFIPGERRLRAPPTNGRMTFGGARRPRPTMGGRTIVTKTLHSREYDNT